MDSNNFQGNNDTINMNDPYLMNGEDFFEVNNEEKKEKVEKDEAEEKKEEKDNRSESDYNKLEDEEEANNYNEDFDKYSSNNIQSNAYISEEAGDQVIKPVSTEEIFLQQKEKIKKLKEWNNIYNFEDSKNNTPFCHFNGDKSLNNENKQKKKVPKIFNGNFKVLTLNDYLFFETASFNYNKTTNKDDKIPLLQNVKWNCLEEPLKTNEFKKLALRTINEVNYNTNGIEISVSFSLEGSSEFWIFTRCFVNKGVNESYLFDTSSLNNEPNIVFNKYTSLLKISKKKYYNKCFASFGTFYEDTSNNNNGQVIYKTFLKRQLVDFNDSNNGYLPDNDICEFNAFILDLGNENIDMKIAMNVKNKFNHIIGNFYLPTNKRSKILFCGVGQSVKIKNLRINNFVKGEKDFDHQYETTFSSEQKNCTCCNIIWWLNNDEAMKLRTKDKYLIININIPKGNISTILSMLFCDFSNTVQLIY